MSFSPLARLGTTMPGFLGLEFEFLVELGIHALPLTSIEDTIRWTSCHQVF
jgi:hypothetical protein